MSWFDELFDEIDRIVRRHIKSVLRTLEASENEGLEGYIRPYIEAVREGDKTKLIAEVPGAEPDKISVEVDGSTVTIRAEGPNRKYFARVSIGHEIDADRAKATYRNGVLEIELPVTRRGKQVKVEIS
jgi:HSP20 family protein